MTTENAKPDSPVTTRALSPGLEGLNVIEVQALENLFAWVAAEQNTAPETVRTITEASFGARDLAAIRRQDYDRVIQFLVDLGLSEVHHPGGQT
jgi:hypothetical protein